MEKRKENSYRKIKRFLEKRHTQTQTKLICYISMIIDVFLNQKRVNYVTHNKVDAKNRAKIVESFSTS